MRRTDLRWQRNLFQPVLEVWVGLNVHHFKMTEFVNPLIAMSCLSALIATALADRSGAMTAPDIDVTVSTNVKILRIEVVP